MAERMLWIGWSEPVRGREERGLEVFNEAMGLWGRMQQEGRIESFDVALLEPNETLNGYMELHGSAQQIAALRMDDEFRRVITDASLCVEGMRLVEGATNEAIAPEMEIYREALSRTPQTA